jgi:DNA repair exonuclease SbcCD ATPase subunit
LTEKLEKKLKKLKENFKENRNEIEDVIDEQEDKFKELLEKQEEQFEQSFDNQEQQFQTSINTLEDEFSQKFESQQVRIQQLEQEVEENRQQLLSKLSTSLEQLNDQFKEKIQEEEEYIGRLEENVELSMKKIVRNIENQKANTDERITALREDIAQENHELMGKIESLKEELDTLKISYTINEKNLLEKVKDVIKIEVKNAVKGYEKEALMNVWIDELKEIINDFEKLKQQNPEEFELNVKKIASTIEFFRKKLKA